MKTKKKRDGKKSIPFNPVTPIGSQVSIRNTFAILFLFLLWPFGAFLVACKNYRRQWAQIIVVLFFSFYGYTFIVWNETNDAFMYRVFFLQYTNYDFSVLWHRIVTLYSPEAERPAIALDIINYVVSRFTNNFHVLFATFGLTFGIFYVKNIWFLLERSNKSNNWNSIVFLIMFISLVPVFYISGFLMYTAMHIFFYGIIQIIMYRRWRYLPLIALAILVHWSFLFPTAVFVIYLVAGSRLKLYVGLFLVSLFFSEFDVSFFSKYIHIFGAAIESKFQTYTDKKYVEDVTQQTLRTSWFLIWRYRLFFYGTWGILLAIVEFQLKKLPDELVRLLEFCFLFCAAVNILKAVPSMSRFYDLYLLLATAFIYLYAQLESAEVVNKAALVLAGPLVLWIVVLLRMRLGSVSPELFFSNPVVSTFFHNEGVNIGQWIFK